ncbi:23781_t:CDS:2, partial [Dentiscutata erythropus]
MDKIPNISRSKNSNSSTITRAKALVPAKRKATKALLQEQPNKKYKIMDSLNKEVKVKDSSTSRDKLTIEDPAWTFALQKFDTGKKENTSSNIDDKDFITVSNKKKNNRKITKS